MSPPLPWCLKLLHTFSASLHFLPYHTGGKGVGGGMTHALEDSIRENIHHLRECLMRLGSVGSLNINSILGVLKGCWDEILKYSNYKLSQRGVGHVWVCTRRCCSPLAGLLLACLAACGVFIEGNMACIQAQNDRKGVGGVACAVF